MRVASKRDVGAVVHSKAKGIEVLGGVRLKGADDGEGVVDISGWGRGLADGLVDVVVITDVIDQLQSGWEVGGGVG